MEQSSLRKKAFKKIKHATINVQMDRQERNIDKSLLQTPDPLVVSGVIYAIIHVPSNRIYVGQTIKDAYSRFKRHWHQRHESDGRNIHLHRLMQKQKTDNFIVWPLEVIDRSLYFDINGRADLRAFRRAATFRERFWIQRLQTSALRGLNCRIPLGRQQNDRMYRPNRWLNRQTNKIVTESCINCVHFNTEGEIQIHSHSGMDSQLRLSAKKLLYMSARYSEQDIKIDIGNMSHKHRIGVLRWLNENISNKDLMENYFASDSVTLIERLLREHLEGPKAFILKTNNLVTLSN